MLYPIELWVRKCRILAERARGVNRFWEHLELNFWEGVRVRVVGLDDFHVDSSSPGKMCGVGALMVEGRFAQADEG